MARPAGTASLGGIHGALRPAGRLPPVSGYSHAVAFSGRTVAVSGQVPADREGRVVGLGDPAAQVRQVFENLTAVLAAAGATMADVVKLMVFLTDLADLQGLPRGPGRVRQRRPASG